jgi:hypothetical protein
MDRLVDLLRRVLWRLFPKRRQARERLQDRLERIVRGG